MTTATATVASYPSEGGSAGSVGDVANRMERLPVSKWQVEARVLIGTATFFDAFDALTIAQVLPVLAPQWGLDGGQVGALIAIGYLGQLVGALGFSWLAERHGRVPAMVLAIVVYALMSIACMFAFNFESLLLFRTVQGFGLGGQVPIAAVYISEITKAHGRGRFVLVYELIFSFGVVLAGLLGLLIVPRFGWQYMFLVGAAPLLIVYTLRSWLPESPRWLASRGRAVDADSAMSTIETHVERATGQALPPVVLKVAQAAERSDSSWSELFRPPYLRRTLVVWSIWFGAYIVYYGISTWLPTLYRTIFNLPLEVALQYGLISNVIGLLGAATCAFTIDLIGRKVWFSLALAGSAVFLFLLAISGVKTPNDVLIYGTGAYFFASGAAIGVYLYTPELYPTRVRALGVGTATAWLRFASILGPIVIGTFIAYGLASIFLLFGVVALIIAGVVALFAVETKEQVLETLSP